MIITNIKIDETRPGYWAVRGDTARFGEDEILFEGGSREECCEYIRREAAEVIRYAEQLAEIDSRKAEDMVDIATEMILDHLTGKKRDVQSNVIGAIRVKGWDCYMDVDTMATETGAYIEARQSRYGYTVYVDMTGLLMNKPRGSKTVSVGRMQATR